jgi:cysteine synthase A
VSVLDGIGNTPIVALKRIVPPGSARIMVKLEWANPTGSLQDRMARAAIEGAEARGALAPGGTVVVYTGGTTGISLAFVCAAKGYRLEIVFSDAFSVEKRRTLLAFGANITDVKSDGGSITARVIKEMIETARGISARPGHWWCDQFNNADASGGYHALGEEIVRQCGGRVDAFVHVVGTAHSIMGTAEGVRRHFPSAHITAVEPTESAVLSGGATGAHRIEGVGPGFVPPRWRRDAVDEITTVSTDEGNAMARRLAREEGIFAGSSSGANVVAALRAAERLGPAATVVTPMCDSGLRYPQHRRLRAAAGMTAGGRAALPAAREST